MTNEQWIVQGYLFHDRMEYLQAKKEQEAIAFIKANSDLSNFNSVLKVYNNLTEKNTFHTIVGVVFLTELRDMLLRHNGVEIDAIKPISVRLVKSYGSMSRRMREEEKFKDLYRKTKQKQVRSVYLNVFLGITIIAMFIITYFSPRNNDTTYEAKILDKYSTWKMELQQKEIELNQREEQLKQEKE